MASPPAVCWDTAQARSPAAMATAASRREQTVLVAYHRGRMCPEHNISGGLMAAVGLGAEEAEARLAKHGKSSCVVGCDNSPNSVTLSGNLAGCLHSIHACTESQSISARATPSLLSHSMSISSGRSTPGLLSLCMSDCQYELDWSSF